MELAIDVGSDPISGSVSTGARCAQPFTGWIELAEAIEAARATSETGRQTLGAVSGAKTTGL